MSIEPPPIPQTATGVAQHESLAFKTALRGRDFIGGAIKLSLLSLITLTLYRFWARTQVRRWMWSGLSLNGESFEYTGLGIELFKGFLLALVVFTLPYLLVVFGAQLLPPLIGGPLLLVFVLFAYWAIGAAIWLSFRYIASRTVWRGIRFQLRGSATDYGWLVFGQTILTSITLGWYAPRAFIKQAEGLWGNLSFGDLPFGFDEAEARKENLYGRFAIAWFGLIFAYFGLIGAVASITSAHMVYGLESIPDGIIEMVIGGVLVGIVTLIAVTLAFAAYNMACLRALVRGLSLDQATFRLMARTPAYLGLVITNALIIVFSLGLLTAVAQVRSFAFITSHLEAEGTVNFATAEQAERGPNQAEGLADSLDIGII
jgi:uncharacterized membrane protein YjgN (DUF898 family)